MLCLLCDNGFAARFIVYMFLLPVCLFTKHVIQKTAIKYETFTQCWFNVGQRRRRWAVIEPTIDACFMIAGQVKVLRSLSSSLVSR